MELVFPLLAALLTSNIHRLLGFDFFFWPKQIYLTIWLLGSAVTEELMCLRREMIYGLIKGIITHLYKNENNH